MRPRFLAACWLAGWRFRDQYVQRMIGEKVLKPGSFFTLRPEPDNPYDPNAIAIYGGGHHFGYVPQKWNRKVWQLIRRYGLENIRALYRGNARIHIVKIN